MPLPLLLQVSPVLFSVKPEVSFGAMGWNEGHLTKVTSLENQFDQESGPSIIPNASFPIPGTALGSFPAAV